MLYLLHRQEWFQIKISQYIQGILPKRENFSETICEWWQHWIHSSRITRVDVPSWKSILTRSRLPMTNEKIKLRPYVRQFIHLRNQINKNYMDIDSEFWILQVYMIFTAVRRNNSRVKWCLQKSPCLSFSRQCCLK